MCLLPQSVGTRSMADRPPQESLRLSSYGRPEGRGLDLERSGFRAANDPQIKSQYFKEESDLSIRLFFYFLLFFPLSNYYITSRLEPNQKRLLSRFFATIGSTPDRSTGSNKRQQQPRHCDHQGT